MSDGAPRLTPTQARQAQKGMGVHRILLISLALVVIAFAVIWAIYAGRLSGQGGQATAPASAAQASNTLPNDVTHNATNSPPGSVASQATGQPRNSTAGG